MTISLILKCTLLSQTSIHEEFLSVLHTDMEINYTFSRDYCPSFIMHHLFFAETNVPLFDITIHCKILMFFCHE